MIPTLSEALHQLKYTPGVNKKVLREYYRRVAAGEVPPVLRNNNAVLAAQYMVVLLDEIQSSQGPEKGESNE